MYSEIIFAGLTGLCEQLLMCPFFIIVYFACVKVVELEWVILPPLIWSVFESIDGYGSLVGCSWLVLHDGNSEWGLVELQLGRSRGFKEGESDSIEWASFIFLLRHLYARVGRFTRLDSPTWESLLVWSPWSAWSNNVAPEVRGQYSLAVL